MHAIPATVECVWQAGAILGEGPCWDSRTRRLYWLDIKSAQLLAWCDDTRTTSKWPLPFRMTNVGVPPNSWTSPDELTGDLLVGCGDEGLVWLALNSDTVSASTLAHPERELPENRFNDGKFGPDGRYWAGTMHDTETKTSGSLYAFARDGSWTRLDDGYGVPNGPAFSPDRRTVYHTDSRRRVIYAFTLDSDGTLRNKRSFVQFGDHDGSPDGMTTDRHGNLWIAMWDGHRIEKISRDGRRAGSISMPTARVTSCVFADSECTTLFATSAKIGTREADAVAGSLFKIRLAPGTTF